MYTEYEVDGANSLGENFRIPINQSEVSIWQKITGARGYATAELYPGFSFCLDKGPMASQGGGAIFKWVFHNWLL